ncbi:Nucleoside diphosphate kinase 1 [Orobanche minor]
MPASPVHSPAPSSSVIAPLLSPSSLLCPLGSLSAGNLTWRHKISDMAFSSSSTKLYAMATRVVSSSALSSVCSFFLSIFLIRSGSASQSQRQPPQETMAQTFIMIKLDGVQIGLVQLICGPVVSMVWEDRNLVTIGRKIIEATNSAESAPRTISGDYAIDIDRNVIHGSDAVESARKEMAMWFPEGVAEWRSSLSLMDLRPSGRR